MQLSVRALRPWAFLGLLLAFFATPLAAQEVGKLQGRVTDAASGQPIAGAQVVIVGTRLGNITNEEGFYFVNNVPAGLQDIQAQYIGYQSVTVRQQRVLAGQTTTQNFQLQQSAVEIAALEVVGEQRPLVPRDQVASKNIVTGDKIDELPVDNVVAIIRGQVGVVATGNKSGFSIRGGRSGEEAVFVDGVLVRNFNAGDSNLTIGTNSLAELDVLTGGFSAEYGEAQSGIINYVTRSGGRSWNGTVSLQTDEVMPKEWGIGFNRAELSLGGPVVGNLGFFFAGTATGEKSANMPITWRDFPFYIAQGVDTVIACTVSTSCTDGSTGNSRDVIVPNFVRYDESGRTPLSNSDEYTLDSKLDYTYGSGSRFFVTGKMSRNQARTNFGSGRGNLYNSQGNTGTYAKSQTGIVGWTHNFVRSAESALALDVKVARQHDFAIVGSLLDPQWDIDNRNPAFGFTFDDMKFTIDNESFPVNDSLLARFLRNAPGGLVPFQDRTDISAATEFRMNPYGVISGFATRGRNPGYSYAEEWQWQYRATVDWQVNRQNRLKFGGEYFDIDTRRYLANSLTNAAFAQIWLEEPKRQSLFAQDRLDLGDVVVEAGLRYDRFDPNSNFPNTPGFYDPEDPSTFSAAPVREAVSPRLGVSFPVTVNSTFRLSYGHFTQLPDLNEYYRGKNTDFFRFRNTNTNDIFTQPLDMGKTVAFEFGYRQLLAPDFVLDVSAYNRDKLKDITSRKLAWEDPTNPGSLTYLNTFTNADFGTIRGIDLRLDRRFGQVLDVTLSYSYQDARNTGTDPFTYVNVFARLESNANTLLGLPPNPAQAIRLTEENRKHNVAGNFTLKFPSTHSNKLLANFGLFGSLRVLSGLPYSPLTNGAANIFIAGQAGGAGLGVTGAELRDDEISTARLPWTTDFSLKAQKGVKIMGWNAQVFVDARNLLDLENQTAIFQTTSNIIDDQAYRLRVEAHRQTLGNGTIQDRIDLRTLSAAGAGVRNEVDLYLLQKAEERFGNGDMFFTAEEQERAFRASEIFLTGPQDLFGSGRRVRVGFELTF